MSKIEPADLLCSFLAIPDGTAVVGEVELVTFTCWPQGLPEHACQPEAGLSGQLTGLPPARSLLELLEEAPHAKVGHAGLTTPTCIAASCTIATSSCT